MHLTRRTYLGGMSAAFGAGLLPGRLHAQVKPLPGLPSTMIWSVGDDDGPRFKEAQAIADILSKVHGTRVRLQPSENAFGRMEQLKQRQVTHGWLGTEAYFAAEGLYSYAAHGWGPQDLRCLLGRMSSMSLIATQASGIKALADLKGKRYAIVPSSRAINIKIDALFEAAGIADKDVTIVEFPNRADALAALISGQVDYTAAVPGSMSARALEPAIDTLQWIELPASNRDLWNKIQRALPLALPFVEDHGPGITKTNPKALMGYRDPVVTVYADANELEVHALTKAIADNYELYRSSSPILERWELPKCAGFPSALPFHDGAIKIYKEKNVWTADHQRWQDGILKRQTALRQGWADMLAKEPAAKDATAEKLLELWTTRRADILKSL
jgi:TRAP transporter TAXI family solute receptor